ncbi:MAG: UDP-N-acetylglucosamine 2-epimerase (non-hydrolyzing) [Desulfomonile tiedjei]|nr:UDP-N-acetylglucosamine 2-epimerase (non-hydrolyzing) [Desulfomonile tiedjei]
MFTVLLAFGTRPEAIKLAPVYKEIARRSDRLRLVCCVTGQHRELLDQMLKVFGMRADHDLRILEVDQTLFHITASVLEKMRDVLLQEKPDILVVQGDTSSAFAAALAAFYSKIPVAHVEAGLRSYDRFQPFPEEINRTFISHMADLNFCPTKRAAENLLNEKIEPDSIHITGNTVIDALLHTVKLLSDDPHSADYLSELRLGQGRMILVTGHRRENFGPGLANLSHALVDLVERFDDVTVVYSVHPNPNVRGPVERILGSHERIRVIPPPDYIRFVALMNMSYLIITDSGGIQEEAPSLKKPVLIVRNVTERPEAVECGAAMLVGTDRETIVRESARLLENIDHYKSMMVKESPFGDGHAAEKIVDTIEVFLNDRTKP